MPAQLHRHRARRHAQHVARFPAQQLDLARKCIRIAQPCELDPPAVVCAAPPQQEVGERELLAELQRHRFAQQFPFRRQHRDVGGEALFELAVERARFGAGQQRVVGGEHERAVVRIPAAARAQCEVTRPGQHWQQAREAMRRARVVRRRLPAQRRVRGVVPQHAEVGAEQPRRAQHGARVPAERQRRGGRGAQQRLRNGAVAGQQQVARRWRWRRPVQCARVLEVGEQQRVQCGGRQPVVARDVRQRLVARMQRGGGEQFAAQCAGCGKAARRRTGGSNAVRARVAAGCERTTAAQRMPQHRARDRQLSPGARIRVAGAPAAQQFVLRPAREGVCVLQQVAQPRQVMGRAPRGDQLAVRQRARQRAERERCE